MKKKIKKKNLRCISFLLQVTNKIILLNKLGKVIKEIKWITKIMTNIKEVRKERSNNQ